MFKIKKNGQSTAEYAIVIGLVIAAAVAMQVYVKRGIQGKMKDATDFTATDTVSGQTIGETGQYEPYYLSQDLTTTQTGMSSSKIEAKGKTTRAIVGQEITSRTGSVTTEAAKY